MNNIDMGKLVRYVQEDKEGRFNDLVREIDQTIYYLASKMLIDPTEAEDATQDILLYIYNHLDDLQIPEGFNRWMNRIVFGICSNIIKHRSNPKEKIYLGGYVDDLQQRQLCEPEEIIQQGDNQNFVLDIIDELPDKQREAVILFYYQGLTSGQISKKLECSVETVQSRLFRAKQSIRLKMEQTKGFNPDNLYGVGLLPLLTMAVEKEATLVFNHDIRQKCLDSFEKKETSGDSKGQDKVDISASKRKIVTAKHIWVLVVLMLVVCGITVLATEISKNKRVEHDIKAMEGFVLRFIIPENNCIVRDLPMFNVTVDDGIGGQTEPRATEPDQEEHEPIDHRSAGTSILNDEIMEMVEIIIESEAQMDMLFTNEAYILDEELRSYQFEDKVVGHEKDQYLYSAEDYRFISERTFHITRFYNSDMEQSNQPEEGQLTNTIPRAGIQDRQPLTGDGNDIRMLLMLCLATSLTACLVIKRYVTKSTGEKNGE